MSDSNTVNVVRRNGSAVKAPLVHGSERQKDEKAPLDVPALRSLLNVDDGDIIVLSREPHVWKPIVLDDQATQQVESDALFVPGDTIIVEVVPTGACYISSECLSRSAVVCSCRMSTSMPSQMLTICRSSLCCSAAGTPFAEFLHDLGSAETALLDDTRSGRAFLLPPSYLLQWQAALNAEALGSIHAGRIKMNLAVALNTAIPVVSLLILWHTTHDLVATCVGYGRPLATCSDRT